MVRSDVLKRLKFGGHHTVAEKVTSNQKKSPPPKPSGKADTVGKGKDNNKRLTARGRKSP